MATTVRHWVPLTSPTVPNNFGDQSGGHISQDNQEVTLSGNTFSYTPISQATYILFTASVIGNCNLVLTNPTQSFVDGTIGQAFRKMGTIDIILTAGASTASVILGSGYKSDVLTYAVPATKQVWLSGICDGTNYLIDGKITI